MLVQRLEVSGAKAQVAAKLDDGGNAGSDYEVAIFRQATEKEAHAKWRLSQASVGGVCN